jgi:hypothetical protein
MLNDSEGKIRCLHYQIGCCMASLALDPMVVAKINGLLASSPSDDPEAGLSVEEIVELFEFCLLDAPTVVMSEQKKRREGWIARQEK